MAKRVSFLVDGFNVYHSIKEAMRDTGNPSLRWLDLRALLSSYLSVFGTEAVLEDIFYFTAYAHHLTGDNPDVVTRHQTYVTALKNAGVTVEVARFKKKSVMCPECRHRIKRHEEKETDVSIAVKALEILHQDRCDALVFVSGDTDLAPAARAAKRMFPERQVCFAFPHKRMNTELQQLADFSFRLRPALYAKHQLPDRVPLPSGRELRKPTSW
ncbi:MAG: NYN domain-containing protein [Gemmatimonadales bacterium]|nr:MAG: NYN domain-containing protein [Gemmatimonadales bacterium]